MRKIAGLFIGATLLTLTGCANGPDLSKKYQPAPADSAPVAAPATDLPAYRLQIGDVIDIRFPLNPELNETVTVRPDGMISTAVAADLPAYNTTVADLNTRLAAAYSEMLQQPRVSAIVRSFAPTRIYVSGEVASPGEFIVMGPALTVTQAIARAGGVLNSAKPEQVLILRRGAGERTTTYLVDYDAATQGGDGGKDVRLAPYDVVFVPKSDAALTYRNYQQYFQQYIAPSLSASYFIN